MEENTLFNEGFDPSNPLTVQQLQDYNKSNFRQGAAPMVLDSKFDQSPVNPWQYIYSDNQHMLETDRAENQGWLGTLGRAGAKIGLDVLAGRFVDFPLMLADIAEVPLLSTYKAIEYGLQGKSIWEGAKEGFNMEGGIDHVQSAVQQIKDYYTDSLFKVYNSQDNYDRGLLGSITTLSGISNDVGNAVSFMVAGRLNSNMITRLGIGEKAAMEFFKKYPNLAPKDIAKLAATGDKIDDVIATLANSAWEAGLEADEAHKQVKESLYNTYLDQLYKYGNSSLNEEEINKRANAAKLETGLINMALLSVTNGIEQLRFRGGYLDEVSNLTSRYLRQGANATMRNVEKKGLASFLDYAWAGAKGFGSEGFVEEGVQQATQIYEKAYAENKTKDKLAIGLATTWAKGISGLTKAITGASSDMDDTEFEMAKSMMVGGLVGMGGSAYARRGERKQEIERESDAFDLYNHYKTIGNADDILKDEQDGVFDVAEDGTKTLNTAKWKRYVKNAINDNVDDALVSLAAIENNPSLHELVKQQAITKYAYRIYNNTLGPDVTNDFLNMMANAEGSNFYKENKQAIDERLKIFNDTKAEHATYDKLTNPYTGAFVKQLAYLRSVRDSIDKIDVTNLPTIPLEELNSKNLDENSYKAKLIEDKKRALEKYDSAIKELNSKEGYKNFTEAYKKTRELSTYENPASLEEHAHNYSVYEAAELDGREVVDGLASETMFDFSKTRSVLNKQKKLEEKQAKNEKRKEAVSSKFNTAKSWLGNKLTINGKSIIGSSNNSGGESTTTIPTDTNTVTTQHGNKVDMTPEYKGITVKGKSLFSKEASMGRVTRSVLPFRDQLALRIGKAILAKDKLDELLEQYKSAITEQLDKIKNSEEASLLSDPEMGENSYIIEQLKLINDTIKDVLDSIVLINDELVKDHPSKQALKDFQLYVTSLLDNIEKSFKTETRKIEEEDKAYDLEEIQHYKEVIQKVLDTYNKLVKTDKHALNIDDLNMDSLALQFFRAYAELMKVDLGNPNLEIDDDYINETNLKLDAIAKYTNERKDISDKAKSNILEELETLRGMLDELIKAKGQETAKRQQIQAFTFETIKQAIITNLGIPPDELNSFSTIKGLVGYLFHPKNKVKLENLKSKEVRNLASEGFYSDLIDIKNLLVKSNKLNTLPLNVRKIFDESISNELDVFKDPINILMTLSLSNEFKELLTDSKINNLYIGLQNIFNNNILAAFSHIDPTVLKKYNENAIANNDDNSSLSEQQQLLELHLLSSLEIYNTTGVDTRNGLLTEIPRIYAGLVGSGKTRTMSTIMNNIGSIYKTYYTTMVPAADQITKNPNRKFDYINSNGKGSVLLDFITKTTFEKDAVLFIDEGYRLTTEEYLSLVSAARGKVKLVLFGDPAQNNKLNRSGSATIGRSFMGPALTATYRTSHPGVSQVYKAFLFNPQIVNSLTALANTTISAYTPNTKGSFAFNNSDQIEKFIADNINKGGRTKLILVDSQAKLDKYKNLYGNVAEVMLHLDAQGKEAEEVYLDMDYNLTLSNESDITTLNNSFYTALGRAKQFVAFVHPTAENGKPRDVVQEAYDEEYKQIKNNYDKSLTELSNALNGITSTSKSSGPSTTKESTDKEAEISKEEEQINNKEKENQDETEKETSDTENTESTESTESNQTEDNENSDKGKVTFKDKVITIEGVGIIDFTGFELGADIDTMMPEISNSFKSWNKQFIKENLYHHKGQFLFNFQGRLFVFVKVGKFVIPYYYSSSGTSGKAITWHPVFGVDSEAGWIMKGAIDKDGNLNYGKTMSSKYPNAINEITRLRDEIRNNLPLSEDLRDSLVQNIYMRRNSNGYEKSLGSIYKDFNVVNGVTSEGVDTNENYRYLINATLGLTYLDYEEETNKSNTVEDKIEEDYDKSEEESILEALESNEDTDKQSVLEDEYVEPEVKLEGSKVNIKWPSSIRFVPAASRKIIILASPSITRAGAIINRYSAYALSESGELKRVGVLSETNIKDLGFTSESIPFINTSLPNHITVSEINTFGITPHLTNPIFNNLKYSYNTVNTKLGEPSVSKTSDLIVDKLKEAFTGRSEQLDESSINIEYIIADQAAINNAETSDRLYLKRGRTYAKVNFKSRVQDHTGNYGDYTEGFVYVELTPRKYNNSDLVIQKLDKALSNIYDFAINLDSENLDYNNVKNVLNNFNNNYYTYILNNGRIELTNVEDNKELLERIINHFYTTDLINIKIKTSNYNNLRELDFSKTFGGTESEVSNKSISSSKKVFLDLINFFNEEFNGVKEPIPTNNQELISFMEKNNYSSANLEMLENYFNVVVSTKASGNINFFDFQYNRIDDSTKVLITNKKVIESDNLKELKDLWKEIAYGNNYIGDFQTKFIGNTVKVPKSLLNIAPTLSAFMKVARQQNSGLAEVLNLIRVSNKPQSQAYKKDFEEYRKAIQAILSKHNNAIDFNRDLYSYNSSLKSLPELINLLNNIDNTFNSKYIVITNNFVRFYKTQDEAKQYADKYNGVMEIVPDISKYPTLNTIANANIPLKLLELNSDLESEMENFNSNSSLDWNKLQDVAITPENYNVRLGKEQQKLNADYINDKTSPTLNKIELPKLEISNDTSINSSDNYSNQDNNSIGFETKLTLNLYNSLFSSSNGKLEVIKRLNLAIKLLNQKGVTIDMSKVTPNNFLNVIKQKLLENNIAPSEVEKGIVDSSLPDLLIKESKGYSKQEIIDLAKSEELDSHSIAILDRLLDLYVDKVGGTININWLYENNYIGGSATGSSISVMDVGGIYKFNYLIHELSHVIGNKELETNLVLQEQFVKLANEAKNKLKGTEKKEFTNTVLASNDPATIAKEFMAYTLEGRFKTLNNETARTFFEKVLDSIINFIDNLLGTNSNVSVRNYVLDIIESNYNRENELKESEKDIVNNLNTQGSSETIDEDMSNVSFSIDFTPNTSYAILNDVNDVDTLNNYLETLVNNPNWIKANDKYTLLSNTIDLIKVTKPEKKLEAFKNLAKVLYNSLLTIEERKTLRDTIFSEKISVPDQLIVDGIVQNVTIAPLENSTTKLAILIGEPLNSNEEDNNKETLKAGKYIYDIYSGNFYEENLKTKREGLAINSLNTLVQGYLINKTVDVQPEILKNTYNQELIISAIALRLLYNDYSNLTLTSGEKTLLNIVDATKSIPKNTAMGILENFISRDYSLLDVVNVNEDIINKIFGSTKDFYSNVNVVKALLQTMVTGELNPISSKLNSIKADLITQIPVNTILGTIYSKLETLAKAGQPQANQLISTMGINVKYNKDTNKFEEFGMTSNRGFKDTKLNLILNLLIGVGVDEASSIGGASETNDLTDYIANSNPHLKLYLGFLSSTNNSTINFQHAYLTAIKLARKKSLGLSKIFANDNPVTSLFEIDKILTKQILSQTEKGILRLIRSKYAKLLENINLNKALQIYTEEGKIYLAIHDSYYVSNTVNIQGKTLYEVKKDKEVKLYEVGTINEAVNKLFTLSSASPLESGDVTLDEVNKQFTNLLMKNEALDFLKLMVNNVLSLTEKNYTGVTLDFDSYDYSERLHKLKETGAQGDIRELIISLIKDIQFNPGTLQAPLFDSTKTFTGLLKDLQIDTTAFELSESEANNVNKYVTELFNGLNKVIKEHNEKYEKTVVEDELQSIVVKNELLNNLVRQSVKTKKVMSTLVNTFEELLKISSNGTVKTPEGNRIFRFVQSNPLDDAFSNGINTENNIQKDIVNNMSDPSYFVGTSMSTGAVIPLFRESYKRTLKRDLQLGFLDNYRTNGVTSYTHFFPSQADKNKVASVKAKIIRGNDVNKYLEYIYNTLKNSPRLTTGYNGLNLDSLEKFNESIVAHSVTLKNIANENKVDINAEEALVYTQNQLIYNYIGLEAIVGDLQGFKNDEDLIKRLNGLVSPGFKLYTGANGSNKQFKVLYLNEAKEDLSTLFKDKSLMDELNRLKDHMSKEFGDSKFDVADGQGIMTESRFSDLQRGLSSSYKIASIFKPVLFDNKHYYKYSSFVLTSQLAANLNITNLYKKIKQIEELHPNLEIIFNSGVKRNVVKDAMSFDDLLAFDPTNQDSIDKLNKSLDVKETDNYRLQSNPSLGKDTTAVPTQLMYFLTLNESAKQKVNQAWSELFKLGKIKTDNILKEPDLNKRLRRVIDGKNIKLLSLLDLGVPANSPLLEDKTFVPYLSSLFNPIYNTVEFPGGQAVLASSVIYKGTNYNLNYKVDNKNGKVLRAECVVPEGKLTSEEKTIIRNYNEVLSKSNAIRENLNKELSNEKKQALTKELTKLDKQKETLYNSLPVIIGFRIPTTGLHSSVPMQIVNYHNLDNKAVFTPLELSILHGSD